VAVGVATAPRSRQTPDQVCRTTDALPPETCSRARDHLNQRSRKSVPGIPVASVNPRPGRVPQKVTCSLTVHGHRSSIEPSLFRPCAPAHYSELPRATRPMCLPLRVPHVGSLDKSLPGLTFNPNPDFRMAAASPCGNLTNLFISTPSVNASSGPPCTAAAPRGTRSLEPVPPLHAFGAVHTPADRNMEPRTQARGRFFS
jgi:hypothetical protein